jgi:exopolysaccharide production protein ExoZ
MDVLLHELSRVLFFGIPSAMIVYGSLQIKARKSLWTYLGDTSYSLYLSHAFILGALSGFWQKFPISPDLVIVTSTSAAVLFAWRICELFEKPIMLWFKRQQPHPRQKITAYHRGIYPALNN